jgi:hypothetical protein
LIDFQIFECLITLGLGFCPLHRFNPSSIHRFIDSPQ